MVAKNNRSKKSWKKPEKNKKDLRRQPVNKMTGAEEMYETLVEKANDGICIIQDGIIKYANPKVFEIGGYEKNEIIGKHFIQFIAPEEKEKVFQIYEKRMRGEKVKDIYETVLIGKDGRRIFVQITAAIIDYKGHPAELIIIRDITEKKEMEKKLKQSEEKYRILTENSTDGIFLAIGYKPVYANPSFLKILGAKSFDDIKDKNLLHFLHPEDRKKIIKDVEQALSGKISIKNYELRLKRLDGKEIFVELSLSKITYDDKPHALGIVRDITEKRRLLEALKEERALFIGGPVVVFKWKAGKRYIPVEYVSPNIKDVFGYKAEDFTSGKIMYDKIIHPDDLKRVLEESAFYKKKGVTQYEQEYRIIDAKGRVRWVHDFTVVRKNAKGKITYYHGYVVDITKRKMAEQELEKERKQLLSIFEGIDEPIYVADPETYEILFANKTIKELFGEKIIGKKCYKVFQNLDEPCSFCTNDKILGKNYGKVYVWEFQNKINKRWYRCIDRAITWPDGRVVRMEIAIDITDRVKAEERVKEALEKEREFKLRTAHFFFNPLAIAKGYLQLALDEKDDIETKIKRAMKAIERVEKVVKNVTQKGEIIE